MKRRQIGNQMDAEKPLSAFSRREMKKAHFFKKKHDIQRAETENRCHHYDDPGTLNQF